MAVLQGAERLAENLGDAFARQVVQLVRIGRGVVVLLKPARVPHVERGGGADRLVGRRVSRLEGLPVGVVRREVRAVMLDEDSERPADRILPVPQPGQAVTVDAGRDRQARERLERRRQVDAGRELADVPAGRDARAAHDQRHLDVGVEGGLLARGEPVLAQVEAVVRAEHEVRVPVQPLGPEFVLEFADHVVDREIVLHPLAERAGDVGLIGGR